MRLQEARQLLGVSETATDDEIKKAFRKLAAEKHPDRNPGDSNAENNFKQINQAYQILNGSEKAEDVQPNPFRTNPYSSGTGIEDILNQMRNSGVNPFFMDDFVNVHQQPRKRPNSVIIDDLDVDVRLSFEETAKGGIKNIKYNRKIYCDNCNGIGDIFSNNQCQRCNGTGSVTTRTQNGFVVQLNTYQCPDCRATGAKSTKCTVCNGSKFKLEACDVNINIPPIGGTYNVRLSANENGNVLKGKISKCHFKLIPTIDGSNSDNPKHNNMRIEGHDIIVTMDLQLDQLLFGAELEIDLFGEQKTLKIPKLTKPGTNFSIYGAGIVKKQLGERGYCKVEVNLKYPKQERLTEELKQQIQNLYK